MTRGEQRYAESAAQDRDVLHCTYSFWCTAPLRLPSLTAQFPVARLHDPLDFPNGKSIRRCRRHLAASRFRDPVLRRAPGGPVHAAGPRGHGAAGGHSPRPCLGARRQRQERPGKADRPDGVAGRRRRHGPAALGRPVAGLDAVPAPGFGEASEHHRHGPHGARRLSRGARADALGQSLSPAHRRRLGGPDRDRPVDHRAAARSTRRA